MHQGQGQGQCDLNRLSYQSWRKCAQRFGSDGDEHTQCLVCNLFMHVTCLQFGGVKVMSSKPVLMVILNSVVVTDCQKQSKLSSDATCPVQPP